MTSDSPWTLNYQPCIHWIFTHKAQISSVSLWPATLRYKINLEHLTVKSTLYTLNIYPWGPNFHLFHSTTNRFQDTKLLKIGNALNDLITDRKHLTVKSILYWTFTSEAEISSVSLYNQPFLRYKVVKNQKCIKWPPNDLEHLLSIVPCIHWIFIPNAQIFIRFALWLIVFEIRG